MKLLYLLEGMVAYVRGAVRRGWRWLRRETEIPDPLQVLPETRPYAIAIDIAEAEDPYRWTPEIDWDDVIVRGED